MIDTNALIAATFAVISQFHTVVSVPPQQIPKGPEDVLRLVIGSPFSPLGVFLEVRNGSSYEVIDGSIRRYETANSYGHLQDPQMLPRLMGPAKLSSNEVFGLAVTTIERLTKQGSPKTNAPPKFGAAGEYRGATLPVYGVSWPLTNSAQGHAAEVEIDARTGEITYLHLPDRCFRDFALAKQISNRVYNPEPPPPPRPRPSRPRGFPYPPTDNVVQAIAALNRVCGKLGMYVGCQTNAAGVDWEGSYLFTNTQLSATIPLYQIRFTNGARFTTIDGAVIAYTSLDAYGNIDTPPRDPKQFFGTVNKRWRDLAKNFEDVLKTNFGFAEEVFSNSMAVTAWGYADAPIGEETHTPIMVMWLPYVDSSIPGHEAKLAATQKSEHGPRFSVEFDLQSGHIKSFGFFHPRLVEVFSRGQKDEN